MHVDAFIWRDRLDADKPIPVLVGIGSSMEVFPFMVIMVVSLVEIEPGWALPFLGAGRKHGRCQEQG